MKKITFSLAALLLSCLGFSQVSIVQDFPTTGIPSGWSTDIGVVTNTQACATASFRANLYYDAEWEFGETEGELVSAEQLSNGADLVITFDYKIVNFSAATVPTDPFDGSITTQISLDGGENWDIDAGVIDNSTHIPGNACATVTYTVPGASVPAGSNVRVRWFLQYGTEGDYYIYLDNISAVQVTSTVPPCTALLTPEEGAQNVLSPILTWTNPGGSPAGYKLTIGTTPTGTNILNNFDVGDVTTYNLNSLLPGATYYVTIVPYNIYGDATGCTASTFTACGALTVPLLEVFDVANPECWARGKGGSITTGPQNIQATNAWIADGFANNGTTGAIKVNVYSTGKNDWIISPFITIPATGYELKFDAAAVEYAEITAPEIPWEADDFVQVLVQVSGSAEWEEVLLFNNQNLPPAAGSSYILNLNEYAAQNIKIAFRAVEGTANGLADIDFSIDNFEVLLAPTIAPQCAANIVVNTDASCGNFASEIAWDPVVNAGGYLISIGTTSGGSDVISGLNIGNSPSYEFAGTVNTTYYVTIVPFNSAGNAAGCQSVQFVTTATGCYCESIPESVDGNGIIGVTVENETYENSGGDTYVDYTATPVTAAQGGEVTVSMTFDTADGGLFSYDYDTHIWVDYNNNYTFEASEKVFSGVSEEESPTVLDATFTIPATTALGNYRMRIAAGDSGQATATPCYNGTYGVTMDFIVTVDQTAGLSDIATRSLKVYPNPVKDVLTLTNTSEISKVEVFNMVGQLVLSRELNTSEAHINMAGLTAGAYIVNITSEGVVKSVKLMKE